MVLEESEEPRREPQFPLNPNPNPLTQSIVRFANQTTRAWLYCCLGPTAEQGQPPIIFYSPFADWEEYTKALKHGALDFLRYPFRAGELQSIVGRALEDVNLVDVGN